MLSRIRPDPVLLSILFLALVLRAAYAVQASGTPLAEVLLLDSEFYDRQALSLLDGKGWTEGVFFMNPLYPYLLAQLPAEKPSRARVDSLRQVARGGRR